MFLIPLLIGFVLNSASAFTGAYSRRWGERGGQLATAILRDVLGIPLWITGLGLAMATPSHALFATSLVTDALAWLLVSAGSLVILGSLRALRWRAAVPSLRDKVEVHGLYAHVRHPLYSGLVLEFAGLALLRPTQSSVLACALGVAWVHVQARLEEVDLLQRAPAYGEYMRRVPRFLPLCLRGR